MVGGSELAGCPSGSESDWYQRASKLLESGNGAAASILFERLREIDSNPSVLEGLGRALLTRFGRWHRCRCIRLGVSA